MLSSLINFLVEYFWIPIIDPTVHYNIYNTLVYAFLFGFAALYIVLPLVKKYELDMNKEFFIGVFPFILAGGFARSLRDAQIIDTIFLETPFIYIIFFAYAISALLATKKLEAFRGIEYHKSWSVIGFATLLVIIPLFDYQNLEPLGIFVIMTIVWSLAGFLVMKTAFSKYLTFAFIAPIFVHYLDATSTVVALSYGAEEKHVLGNVFIDVFGPYGMFLMKTLVIVPVVYYIFTRFEDVYERNYYLFLITLLGLGITTRNMVSLIVAT